MRVLICGDRYWDNIEVIRIQLLNLNPTAEDILMHGACTGADTFGSFLKDIEVRILFAESQAKALGFGIVLPFRPEWKKFGKSAGPIRNRQMLVEGQPDLALAFHDDVSISKGTRDMINQLSKANVPYQLFNNSGEEVKLLNQSNLF